jgi:oligopeptide transport system ATP-binding protein
VGESGCGKSTLGRAVLRLVRATSGSIRFDGHEITTITRSALTSLRPRMQLVFQDAGAALNPRWSVARLVGEPLKIHRHLIGAERQTEIDRLLDAVGLDSELGRRVPRQLSGGQRQRVGIARALALEPDLLICDEPTSALDLSIQAQIIELLLQLQERLGLSYLFIAHDLGVVRRVSDRVAVMYLGKIVESAPCDALFDAPRHPYTQALLASVPVLDPERARRRLPPTLAGEIPSAANPPIGCNFCTRCPDKGTVMSDRGIDCDHQEPELAYLRDGHGVACHLEPGAG